MPQKITNKKLQKQLATVGLEKVLLYKDYGYFFITSDDDEMWSRINQLPTNSIYVNSFNQLSIEEWIEEIVSLFN